MFEHRSLLLLENRIVSCITGDLFKLLKQKIQFLRDIVAFGLRGTGGGGAWRKRPVHVSATPARGRTQSYCSSVPSIFAIVSRVMLAWRWAEKNCFKCMRCNTEN